MAFVKGQSGNPGGRPKAEATITELARKHCPKALKELARIATEGKSEQARVAACNTLLDRGYGRAPQQLKISGMDDGPVQTVTMTHEEYLKSIEVLQREI